MHIILNVSELIDTETCPWLCYQNLSGTFTNWTYRFYLPDVLCKIVSRLMVIVVSPVVTNKFISFKAVTEIHFDWLQFNHLKVLLLSFFKCIFRSGIEIDL